MKRFEELLTAYWYACEVYVRASCSDYTADELDSYHVATVAARSALVEYVRELIEPKPGDPCVGASRDTGVW